ALEAQAKEEARLAELRRLQDEAKADAERLIRDAEARRAQAEARAREAAAGIEAARAKLASQRESEEARLAEIRRLADEARKLEEARLAELRDRQAAAQSAAEKALAQTEEARRHEEARLAELRRQQEFAGAEAARLADLETKRAAEERRLADLRRAQDEALHQTEEELAKADAARRAQEGRLAEIRAEQARAQAAATAGQATQAAGLGRELAAIEARRREEEARLADALAARERTRAETDGSRAEAEARLAAIQREYEEAIQIAEKERRRVEEARRAEEARYAELVRQRQIAEQRLEETRQAAATLPAAARIEPDANLGGTWIVEVRNADGTYRPDASRAKVSLSQDGEKVTGVARSGGEVRARWEGNIRDGRLRGTYDERPAGTEFGTIDYRLDRDGRALLGAHATHIGGQRYFYRLSREGEAPPAPRAASTTRAGTSGFEGLWRVTWVASKDADLGEEIVYSLRLRDLKGAITGKSEAPGHAGALFNAKARGKVLEGWFDERPQGQFRGTFRAEIASEGVATGRWERNDGARGYLKMTRVE
ncbi:MAG: hypothetical protein KC466_11225, partial [Myxococcales bacterium]|nr:hypothetical protein [Myxococcales bacterium]